MHTWKDMIDSLSTRGGTIVLLLVCTLLCGVAMVLCMHYHLEGDAEITIRNAFVGFSGALLGALANEGKANGKIPLVLPPAPGEKKE